MYLTLGKSVGGNPQGLSPVASMRLQHRRACEMVRPLTVRQEFPVQIDDAESKYVTCLVSMGEPSPRARFPSAPPGGDVEALSKFTRGAEITLYLAGIDPSGGPCPPVGATPNKYHRSKRAGTADALPSRKAAPSGPDPKAAWELKTQWPMQLRAPPLQARRRDVQPTSATST